MKVLAINGSPKGNRSNTWKLTKRFLEGMAAGVRENEEAPEAGPVGQNGERLLRELQVEALQINALEIHPCLGCFSCWNKTPGTCCIKDDMEEVIQKILWADVVIWSFPLYYYTVPGGMKNLIDRQLPMVLPYMVDDEGQAGSGSHPSRYDMGGKSTVLISTCGFYSAEGNYDGVCSLFDHICGKGEYTSVFCGQGELFRVPELSQRTEEYLKFVYTAGKEYVQKGIKPETREKLGRLLYPREVFESMADASWGIDKETGEKEPEALAFTRQMAALYRKESYPGKDLILEMCYTDLNECYQVILGKEGSQVLTNGSGKATTRIETPFTVWRSIAAGELRGDEALMRHMYRVKGDFSLMMNWDANFGNPESSQGQTPIPGEMASEKPDANDDREQLLGAHGNQTGVGMPTRGTNMNLLLIPWIVFWVAVPIDGFWGSCLTLAACVGMPLLFYRNRKTFYDQLSGALVAGFSILSIMGVSGRIVVSFSYFVFGAMWAVSCLCKVPLTACYSMNRYNGEAALRNPIFVRTNRILTLLWGILYLITPIWTYLIMGTEIDGWVGAVNSVIPVLMGIFTVWFQRWYPARLARG